MMLLNHGAGVDSWESFYCKEIKPVNPNRNQPWVFIGRTDAEAEAPILWPPDVKSWLTGKDPNAGKDWRRKEKGVAEDEMVGWHHWLNGHEFEQALGGNEGKGSLACCSPWGHKELDTTERLNNNNNNKHFAPAVSSFMESLAQIFARLTPSSHLVWSLLRPYLL